MGQKGSKRGKIKGIDDQIVYQDDQKVGVDDFELLNVLGRGSFGKVVTPTMDFSFTLYR
mgnify:CR=1 FL=1